MANLDPLFAQPRFQLRDWQRTVMENAGGQRRIDIGFAEHVGEMFARSGAA
jgi:hypothetical protein